MNILSVFMICLNIYEWGVCMIAINLIPVVGLLSNYFWVCIFFACLVLVTLYNATTSILKSVSSGLLRVRSSLSNIPH
jgi:hypothetical protein